MVNAWSLAYDVINGTLDENFPPMTDNTITSLESDEYDPKPKSDKEDSDWKDPVITVGSGNTASAYASEFNIDLSGIESVSINKDELNKLIAFYKSPLGQKSLQVLPEMTHAGGNLGKKYAEKYSENFKENLTRIMKKYPRE